MTKEKLAQDILDMNSPVFLCPLDRCDVESLSPLEFLEHLKLDHTHKELSMYIERERGTEILRPDRPLISPELREKRSLDRLVCLDDTGKTNREIASYLAKHFLNGKMMPNIHQTKIYNVMANYSHIATVDCWDFENKDVLWSYIVIHHREIYTSEENKIDLILDNDGDDRMEVALEIAVEKYGEF